MSLKSYNKYKILKKRQSLFIDTGKTNDKR